MKIIKYMVLLIGATGYAQLETVQTTYEYDNLNRLVQVAFNDGSTVEYSYDNLGNRLTKQIEISQDLTYVPDDAFEQKLIDEGYDDVMDDYVVTSNISSINIFSLFNLGVQDLTGIEDFAELTSFTASQNQITQADFSNNSNLSTLIISDNLLTSIELGNISLAELIIDDNQLTTFNASAYTSLTDLRINDNGLVSISITNLPNLNVLHVHNNPVDEIDFSGTNSVSWISTYNTDVESLDLSQQTNLLTLHTWETNLSFLDLQNGFNQDLGIMIADNNPELFCIQVDDENAANNGIGVYSNWQVDGQVVFSEDCALGVDDLDSSDLLVVPNPASNILELHLPEILSPGLLFIEIFDMNGRSVFKLDTIFSNNHINIPVKKLPSGVYYLRVSIDDSSWSKEFIKE